MDKVSKNESIVCKTNGCGFDYKKQLLPIFVSNALNLIIGPGEEASFQGLPAISLLSRAFPGHLQQFILFTFINIYITL